MVGGEGDGQLWGSGRGAIAGCHCSVLWLQYETHTYMILLIRQFRDPAHHCRAARTRVLNIFNTWPGWLENLFDKVLEPAFCTASSTPWSADTLMTALKGPRVVGSARGFNAG